MSVFTCIANAFSGKSNCPNNCDKNLKDCKEERERLMENNAALTKDRDSYKSENEQLTKAKKEFDDTVEDLKKRAEQAEEAANKYEALEQDFKEYKAKYGPDAKESFIGSLSTVTSVCVILVIVFAVGALIVVAFVFWRKHSRKPANSEVPAGLLE